MPFFERFIPKRDGGGEVKNKLERKIDTEKRPHYRYFYHGTFAGNLDDIQEDGFNFRERHPTLSMSPHYCLRGWTDPEKLKERGREEPEGASGGMLLVIERPEEYQVLPAEEGAPVELEDKIVFVRGRWFNYHQALVSRESRKRGGEKKAGSLPPNQIKMALEPTADFKNIFIDFRRELAQGNAPEDEYILKLSEYLKRGRSVFKDQVEDKQELAENMITGEFQQYLVENIRRLSLNIQFYKGQNKGQRIIQGKERRDFKPWPKEKAQQVIASLKRLNPRNKFLQRYIDLYLPDLEKEWGNL